jgi:ribose transport system ATP-binding protein
MFGIDPPPSGQIRVVGRSIHSRTPRDAIRAGMALVPEDRKASGLIQELAVRENISLAALRQNKRAGGFLNSAFERDVADEMIARLSIRTPSAAQLARNLSGGNQQKVVLAKWLALRPRVLLLDEPTRGVDVGSKHEIYAIMEQLAGQGVAILFASSDMEEVLGMSDRVLVMHEGRIAGEIARDALSEQSIMQLATGRAPAA